jgi:uncharacterized protein YjbI with pentapeptide repeats
MPQFNFLHRSTGAVLLSTIADTPRKAVEAAIRAGTSLANADLSGLDVRGANLEGGVFTNANCKATLFDQAILRGADFTNATLTNASWKDVLSHKVILTGAETTNFTHQKRD